MPSFLTNGEKMARPRKTKKTSDTTPEHEDGLEAFKNSGWLMHIWYEHKFHNNTYAMVLPVEDSDLCRLLIRVDVHGAGTATSMVGTRMTIKAAMDALGSSYRMPASTPRINFGTQI